MATLPVTHTPAYALSAWRDIGIPERYKPYWETTSQGDNVEAQFYCSLLETYIGVDEWRVAKAQYLVRKIASIVQSRCEQRVSATLVLSGPNDDDDAQALLKAATGAYYVPSSDPPSDDGRPTKGRVQTVTPSPQSSRPQSKQESAAVPAAAVVVSSAAQQASKASAQIRRPPLRGTKAPSPEPLSTQEKNIASEGVEEPAQELEEPHYESVVDSDYQDGQPAQSEVEAAKDDGQVATVVPDSEEQSGRLEESNEVDEALKEVDLGDRSDDEVSSGTQATAGSRRGVKRPSSFAEGDNPQREKRAKQDVSDVDKADDEISEAHESHPSAPRSKAITGVLLHAKKQTEQKLRSNRLARKDQWQGVLDSFCGKLRSAEHVKDTITPRPSLGKNRPRNQSTTQVWSKSMENFSALVKFVDETISDEGIQRVTDSFQRRKEKAGGGGVQAIAARTDGAKADDVVDTTRIGTLDSSAELARDGSDKVESDAPEDLGKADTTTAPANSAETATGLPDSKWAMFTEVEEAFRKVRESRIDMAVAGHDNIAHAVRVFELCEVLFKALEPPVNTHITRYIIAESSKRGRTLDTGVGMATLAWALLVDKECPEDQLRTKKEQDRAKAALRATRDFGAKLKELEKRFGAGILYFLAPKCSSVIQKTTQLDWVSFLDALNESFPDIRRTCDFVLQAIESPHSESLSQASIEAPPQSQLGRLLSDVILDRRSSTLHASIVSSVDDEEMNEIVGAAQSSVCLMDSPT